MQISLPIKDRDTLFSVNLLEAFVWFAKGLIDRSALSYISGIVIVCKGKWSKTASGRSQRVIFNIGRFSLKNLVTFGSSSTVTKYGVCHVKVWVNYKWSN
jgi:ribosomal protein S3